MLTMKVSKIVFAVNDSGESECDSSEPEEQLVNQVAQGLDRAAEQGVIQPKDAVGIIVNIAERSEGFDNDTVVDLIDDVFEGDNVVKALVTAVKDGDVRAADAIDAVELIKDIDTKSNDDAEKEQAFDLIVDLQEDNEEIEEEDLLTAVEGIYDDNELVGAIVDGVREGDVDLENGLGAVDKVARIDDEEAREAIEDSLQEGDLEIDEVVTLLDNVAGEEEDEGQGEPRVEVPTQCIANPVLCAGDVETEQPQECINDPDSCIAVGDGFVRVDPTPAPTPTPTPNDPVDPVEPTEPDDPVVVVPTPTPTPTPALDPEPDVNIVPIPPIENFLVAQGSTRINVGFTAKLDNPNVAECSGSSCNPEDLTENFSRLAMGPADLSGQPNALIITFSPIESSQVLLNQQYPPNIVFSVR